ncbi:MAG: DUF2155 domain-containing protein, partial [Pseudomonadota bacterium]
MLWRGLALLLVLAAPLVAQVYDPGGSFSETPLDPTDGARVVPGTPPANFSEPRLLEAPRARLRGLDTLDNTVNDFEIDVGQTLIFKRLEVTLEACRYREGGSGTDAFAFLRIRDRREAEPRFEGWMMSS